jgi:hypothetical protein
MSVEVKINITLDSATPALQAKMAALKPHTLATKIAPPLAQHWRDHLAALPRNKHGYPSTGFWEDAARRVQGIATDDGAILSCDKLGIRQRLYGGPISAVHGKNVSIPLCEEAYGTSPKDWGDTLTLVILGDGRKFLALWLGSEEARASLKAAGVGKRAKRSDVVSRRAHQFSSSTHERPKIIVFKPGSGGSSNTIARTERHMDLKFLFKLQPTTADQEPNPNVIPPDLADVARMEVLKAVSE